MAAVGDIRFTVRAAFLDGIRNHPVCTDVQVEHGWPGDTLERESIWLAESDGELDVPNFRGQPDANNPITHDDLFSVPVEVQAGGRGKSMAAAEERCQQLTNAVEAVARTDPTLNDLTGILWLRIARMRGPVTVPTKEGAVCFARLELEVKARMTEVPR